MTIACTCPLASTGQLLNIDGKDLYIHGINIPWRHYGEDFGVGGKLEYESEFFDRLFEKVSNAGLNTVRMWIHCDGRSYPQRTFDRMIKPLPTKFLEDMETFIDQAAKYNLLVMPVLWTFELVDSRQKDILTKDTVLQSYIDHALVPMVSRLRDKCNLLAWEVINEPEWAMDIRFGGTTRETISAVQMQRFIGKIALAIHEHSTHNVTVGSAGLRFSTDAFPLAKNYWHDLAFRNAGIDCAGPVLNFYNVHYYDWNFEGLSPFSHSTEELGFDKPTLIGEFGQHAQTTKTLMEKALSNGYAGTMPWSMMAGDDVGRWEDYEMDLKEFAVGKEAIIKPAFGCIERIVTDHGCNLYPNPASHEVFITGLETAERRLNVFDWSGRLVDQLIFESGVPSTLQVRHYPTGTYHLEMALQGPSGWKRQRAQKLLIMR